MDEFTDGRRDTPEGVDLLALAEGDETLAATLRQLRSDVDQPVPNDIAAMHLRAILTASAAAPRSASTSRRWRRRVASVGGFSALKLAAGAMAAAAATGGGLAATGNLPDAAQRGVASVAERIGIDLPSPALDAPGRPDLPGDARSDVGTENGRDDEVRPTEPGRPESPGRSADAPGQENKPDEPGARPEGRGEDQPGDAADERDRPDTPADDRRPTEPGPGADETVERGRSDDTPAEKPADAEPEKAPKGGPDKP